MRWYRNLGASHFLLTSAWALVVSAGMAVMIDYETRPGQQQAAPRRWPGSSQIQRHATRYQLVMFVHPRCPCSRASVGELALIMANCRGQLSVHVRCIKPQNFDVQWSKTDLWRSAAAIPGVTVAIDLDGTEAKRFGAATSGQVVLYDPAGTLLFSGGITASRGHSGDNRGRSMIIRRISERIGTQASRLEDDTKCCVFGCPLFNDAAVNASPR